LFKNSKILHIPCPDTLCFST